ncbi:MAG: Fe-S cluster assembly protein SufE [Kangiella sp.]|nr:MAG: Fe-S cluster assembly protein SufE [Kangiella sp.]
MNLSDEIVDTLSFFDSWEDRYRYMIDLGKELPVMDQSLRTDNRIVPGCQSQVWIDYKIESDKLIFQVDSDALIVKGLLAIVMAAYNNKTKQEIRNFDIENYFLKLDLIKHLSPTRGNGLMAMVEKIRILAN